MAERVVLINKAVSKTGRTLVQEENMVLVMSACCSEPITDTYPNKMCSVCKVIVPAGPEDSWSVSFRVAPTIDLAHNRWGEWLKYWFGIDTGDIRYSDDSSR